MFLVQVALDMKMIASTIYKLTYFTFWHLVVVMQYWPQFWPLVPSHILYIWEDEISIIMLDKWWKTFVNRTRRVHKRYNTRWEWKIISYIKRNECVTTLTHATNLVVQRAQGMTIGIDASLEREIWCYQLMSFLFLYGLKEMILRFNGGMEFPNALRKSNI